MRPRLLRPSGLPGPALVPASGYPTAPTLTSVSPDNDRVAGGATVTLTGERFLAGATVQFGTTSVAATVVSPTEITVTAPAHVEGIVDITVTNPNGQSDTIEQAFTFIAGHITGLSLTRGPITGGTEVFIFGANFLSGSTIQFGGVSATGVVFVDADTYRAITPAHAAGVVDVTITEPSTTVVTGASLFGYTEMVFGEDRRRKPSLTIQESTGGGPNTASYKIDGRGVPPIGLEPSIFADNDGNTLFGGQVMLLDLDIEAGNPANLVWGAGCGDHSFRFNKYLPYGLYSKVSASDVARDLVNRFAPGFTTTHIQSGLPLISMMLDGSENMISIFNKIKSMVPRLDFFLDPERGVHLAIQPLVPREGPPSEPVGYGAAAMTVTESTVSTLGLDFKAGYYYFYSSFVYTSQKTYTTPHVSIPIPPSPGYVQLSDQAADLNLTGSVSNGAYGLGFFRGWAMYDGSGNFINDGWAGHIPRVAGDVIFASQDVATVLENKTGFESKLSAISDPLYLSDFLPQFDDIPIGPSVGSRDCTDRAIYAVRIGDEAILGSWAGLKTYALVGDNTTTGPIVPVPTFANPARKARRVSPPVAPQTPMTATESATAIGTAPLDREAQAGYWAFVVTGVYADGTQSRASAQTGQMFFDGTKYASLTGIPIFVDIGTVPCVFRIAYASIFEPAPAGGIPDFTIGNTRRVALILDNTSTEAEFPFGVSLIGGENNPPNLPPVPYLPQSGTALIVDNSTPTLQLQDGLAPKLSLDFYQLRNRVIVRGKGTIMAQDAAVGSRTLVVADTSSFSPTGGRLAIGHRILDYKSLSVSTSGKTIILTQPLTEPVRQSDWLFGGGLPVRPLLRVDDLESQNFCSLAELDENGLPTDGVHEHSLTNDDLATPQQMHDAGMAQLQYAWPTRKVEYAIRDPEHRKGETVFFDLSSPPISGYFVIDEVKINQVYDVSPTLPPLYNVTASTARQFTFNDLMRSIGPISAQPSVAGVVDAAVAQSGGVIPANTPVQVTVVISGTQMASLYSAPVLLAAGIPGKVLYPRYGNMKIVQNDDPNEFGNGTGIGGVYVCWIGGPPYTDTAGIPLFTSGLDGDASGIAYGLAPVTVYAVLVGPAQLSIQAEAVVGNGLYFCQSSDTPTANPSDSITVTLVYYASDA